MLSNIELLSIKKNYNKKMNKADLNDFIIGHILELDHKIESCNGKAKINLIDYQVKVMKNFIKMKEKQFI